MAKRNTFISSDTVNKMKSKAKTKSSSSTDIDMIAALEEGEHKCLCCGKIYPTQIRYFPPTKSPLFLNNGGYVPICKTCLEKYSGKLAQLFKGDEELVLERICQICDWYYAPLLSNMTITAGGSIQGRVRIYPKMLNVNQVAAKSGVYLDTVLDRLRDNNTLDKAKEETLPNITKEMIAFWGGGYTPGEYEFLEREYQDWKNRYEVRTKVQEELFKNITTMQLTIQQIRKDGTAKELNDAMKTLQDLLGSANLKPSQNSGEPLTDAQTFGTLIRQWENEDPIPECAEEFKDVDNIKKYIDTFMFGHLAKMMKVDNDYSQAYEAEIGKYTVEPPRYYEDEDIVDIQIESEDTIEEDEGK